jgi:hypothetical protein
MDCGLKMMGFGLVVLGWLLDLEPADGWDGGGGD